MSTFCWTCRPGVWDFHDIDYISADTNNYVIFVYNMYHTYIQTLHNYSYHVLCIMSVYMYHMYYAYVCANVYVYVYV